MNATRSLEKPNRYDLAMGKVFANSPEAISPEFVFKGRPMTVEETEQFVILHMSDRPETALGESGDDEFENMFLCQIIKKRLDAYKLPFKMTDKFLVISMATFADNPGKIMILLRLCWQHYVKNQTALFNFNAWVDMFPWGVPTEEEMKVMWDSQKASEQPLGNLLDNGEAWKC